MSRISEAAYKAKGKSKPATTTTTGAGYVRHCGRVFARSSNLEGARGVAGGETSLAPHAAEAPMGAAPSALPRGRKKADGTPPARTNNSREP